MTAIVAMTKWFANELGLKNWTYEASQSNLFMAGEVLDEISMSRLAKPGKCTECFEKGNDDRIPEGISI